MNIYIDLPSIIYFIITLICGIIYGLHCYRNGMQNGIDDTIEMLYQQGIIEIDDETGEIFPSKRK